MRRMTVKDSIEQRRSIRKFKPDPVPDEYVTALLDAARLAPSGCNAQPWRFKVVRDEKTRLKLAEAAFSQSFVAAAPVVIVCCADIRGYLDGSVSGAQDLGKIGAVEGRVVEIILERTNRLRGAGIAQGVFRTHGVREGEAPTALPVEGATQAPFIAELGPALALNVAVAVEHMVLRAQDFGLGTCWVRLIDGQKIREIFGWDETIYVVSLLPLGYPDEAPAPRKRREIKDILID